ncbi:uncharacterized protein [Arachis hypogaea]|uniref:uncharacterized protein n=1 Tax=Arachis hypogaea TaxID=3818 RepID=UPI000DEC3090|nr:uncharacterized protein LOC112795795 [Arachis hypogaea]
MIGGLSMEVGNDKTVRFWEDAWLTSGVLKDLFPRLFSVSNLRGSFIRDFKLTTEREDRVVWKFDRSGVFSTKSFMQVMQEAVLPEEITSYSFTRAIWRGFVPPKVELFAWFVLVERVNTKKRLGRLGVIDQLDNMCALCCKSVKSAFHLFLGFALTWQVWCAWLFALGREWSVPGTLKQHFESWTNASLRKYERKRWLIGFFAAIWAIWLERNDRLFRNQGSGVVKIINRSFVLFDEWIGGTILGC